MTNNLIFFIQARTGSTRLPNKVLLPFFNKKSILDLIVQKIKDNFKGIPLVVCTSDNEQDDQIVNFCLQNNINYFRGSENNVLKRFVDAAKIFNAKKLIRICADNPFLDIDFLKELIEYNINEPNADYWSYKTSQQVPVIKTHFGFFAEIVTTNALERVSNYTNDQLYFEHVTNYIYSDNRFDVKLKLLPDYLKDRTDLRFTIDDEQDFLILKEVYTHCNSVNYNIKEIISFVEKNPLILESMIKNIQRYSK